MYPKKTSRTPSESFLSSTHTVSTCFKSLEECFLTLPTRKASRRRKHFTRASEEVKDSNRHGLLGDWRQSRVKRTVKKVKLTGEQGIDKEHSVGLEWGLREGEQSALHVLEGFD